MQTAATLLGGGAVGALITTFVTNRRSRQQPVGYKIDVLKAFSQEWGPADLDVVLRVGQGPHAVEFHHLSLAEIELVNRGNRDFPSFECGFTLGSDDQAINADPKGPDRHHTVSFVNRPNPKAPTQVLDVKLAPFNRGDVYTILLHIVPGDAEAGPDEIKISSAEPVYFRKLPTFGDIAGATMDHPLYLKMIDSLLPRFR